MKLKLCIPCASVLGLAMALVEGIGFSAFAASSGEAPLNQGVEDYFSAVLKNPNLNPEQATKLREEKMGTVLKKMGEKNRDELQQLQSRGRLGPKNAEKSDARAKAAELRPTRSKASPHAAPSPEPRPEEPPAEPIDTSGVQRQLEFDAPAGSPRRAVPSPSQTRPPAPRATVEVQEAGSSEAAPPELEFIPSPRKSK